MSIYDSLVFIINNFEDITIGVDAGEGLYNSASQIPPFYEIPEFNSSLEYNGYRIDGK